MFKLRLNGVQTILSIHRFQWVSQYTNAATTVKSSNSMVEYLVNSIGFSKEEAFVTSSKVSSFKSTENPNSVIDFFKMSGLSQTQIKNLVSKAPKILSCNVDKTLKPKIQAFQDMGVCGSDLGQILILCPDVCWRSLNDHIIPTLEILKSVFCNDSDYANANKFLITSVKKSPWLLGPGAKRELPAVISLLQSYGLSVDQIKAFSLRKTRYLSLGTKLLEPVLIRVEKLGIPHGSPMFFHGICALCSLSEANLELRMGIYKSYGFTEANILTLARKNPYALLISESKLRTCLDFFMNHVGYQATEIASMPYVLTLSLEKRVIPRYTVWKGLKEKRYINVSLVTCLSINEPQFFEKFVRPFKDQCPDLYSDYMKGARSVVEAAK